MRKQCFAAHQANTTFGDTDFCLVGILAGIGAKTGFLGAYVVVLLFLVVTVGLASFVTLRLSGPRAAGEAQETTETADIPA
jgi:PTS system ascorbate-specific IIC component